jgi:hypothetical protein
MGERLARFHRVAALAETPTPLRRLAAAVLAAPSAFLLTYLLLGVVAGGGSEAVFFAAFALAVAAAMAAATLNRARAAVYGLLAALWLLAEGLVLALGAVVASLG